MRHTSRDDAFCSHGLVQRNKFGTDFDEYQREICGGCGLPIWKLAAPAPDASATTLDAATPLSASDVALDRSPAGVPPPPLVSPDGRFWWDGVVWVAFPTSRSAGQAAETERNSGTEVRGRSAGETAGYAVRSFTGTTVQPARESWARLYEVPKWQIVLGWVSVVFNLLAYGIGLVLLPIIALAVASTSAPGGKLPRILRAYSILFLVEVPIIVVIVITILKNTH